MYYRANLYSHGKKIAFMINEVAPILTEVLGGNFDIKKTLATALVHDDPELVTGDYMAGDKAKMTAEELAAIDDEERAAINTLSERYPKTIGGFSYRELQLDVQDLRTPEARVAKFLDTMDGYGEGIHELYAGNHTFVHHIVNEFGLIPLFDDLNFKRRAAMMEKYYELAALKNKHIFFELIQPLEWEPIIEGRMPHTKESVGEEVGYPQYDLWKKLILSSGDSEEIENLYTQRESL